MTSDWKHDVPTTGVRHLPPDSRYMEALSSQGYGFEVAIADLIDNSIDAGARDVVVHFLRHDDQLLSLLVIDDGCGMTDEQLDLAMTVGGRQAYDSQSLGMFGTGLKSASLSHASSVTVVSKFKTSRPAGRRWLMERAVASFDCDVVDPRFAQELMDRYTDCPIVWSGTIVRWDNVKNFPRSGGGGQTDRYLHRTINKLGFHLGLFFHRFLVRDDFNITIAVEDVVSGVEYMNFGVVPLDPFAHPVSGAPKYPREFVAGLPNGKRVSLEAHIWPPKSTVDEFKAVGSVMERQGFYFYRNDRLIQAGGWNNYRQPEAHLALARIAVDIPPESESSFRISVKKEGVDVSPETISALELAVDDDGRGLPEFLKDAQGVYRDARKNSGLVRRPVILPGKGLDVSVRETIEDELPSIPQEEPIAMRWSTLETNEFFVINREHRTIHLNQQYRAAILGGRKGTLNDAPVLKSLMYLLLHQLFEKDLSGRREKDNLDLWQSILVTAARAELDRISDAD
ncbi:ATP-binding protein [Rhodococcoides fascians]|uniref:ATP-binding protein n=1 Tax=Rhodococcoides fascians TaxID=1828 RepID=UPI001DCF0B3E|nr:ATP-binding protein [Rhodococcus fascians]CAH0230002.1 DNA mismatch repair protein MutL [Rhodococcus fascians]